MWVFAGLATAGVCRVVAARGSMHAYGKPCLRFNSWLPRDLIGILGASFYFGRAAADAVGDTGSTIVVTSPVRTS
jgi:hypothetical protein